MLKFGHSLIEETHTHTHRRAYIQNLIFLFEIFFPIHMKTVSLSVCACVYRMDLRGIENGFLSAPPGHLIIVETKQKG